jgi:hypothetical protein
MVLAILITSLVALCIISAIYVFISGKTVSVAVGSNSIMMTPFISNDVVYKLVAGSGSGDFDLKLFSSCLDANGAMNWSWETNLNTPRNVEVISWHCVNR